MIKKLRAIVWSRAWRLSTRLPLRLSLRFSSMRCNGSKPAAAWIPAGNGMDDGYYRWGLLRQYCQLPRWHRGDCIAPISPAGDDEWSTFSCGKRWHR